MNRVDAVVVGGGPAGTTAAVLLAREGYEVVLLDREKFPRDKACGEFINPNACDRMEDVFGIDRNHLLAAGASNVSHVRLQLRQNPPLNIPMLDQHGRGVSGVSLRRLTADAMLVNCCRQVGVKVFEGHNVRSVERSGSEMTVSGQGDDGSPFEYRSHIVIAADGTHSVIARQEGLTVPKSSLKSIGVVAHFHGLDPVTDSAPKVWMFPSSGDGAMFGFARQDGDSAVLSGSIPRQLGSFASDPERFLRRWIAGHSELELAIGGAVIDGPIKTTACFGHRLKCCFAPGILFLGDAARFSDPFTGEGIHHAVESGILAARTALPALATGDTSARTLSAYERDRAELSSRYSLCEIVRAICMRPGLLNFIGERLRAKPALGQTLIGALVDVLPSRSVVSPAFLLRALTP